jgi:hypothetical protein
LIRLLGSAARRFSVPARKPQARRAQRQSRLAAGHAEGARSGLDGREHDATLERTASLDKRHHPQRSGEFSTATSENISTAVDTIRDEGHREHVSGQADP